MVGEAAYSTRVRYEDVHNWEVVTHNNNNATGEVSETLCDTRSTYTGTRDMVLGHLRYPKGRYLTTLGTLPTYQPHLTLPYLKAPIIVLQ